MAAERVVREVNVDVSTGEATERTWMEPATPLDAVGVLATLLAVNSVLPVEDAASAVGLLPEDLVSEAQAWAVAAETA